MKVSEIREILKNYTEKEKDNIIIELYNKFPKKMRESKNIDAYLKNANVKKDKLLMTFDGELLNELDYFIKCVEQELYASPNKIISKEERQKWRFKVKRYYKILMSTDPTTEEGKLATDYLITLFKLLDYGTETLMFTTWDTFSSIGVPEVNYLNKLYDRILVTGKSEENLIRCAKLSLIHADRFTLYSDGISELNFHVDLEEKIKLIEILNKEIENNKKSEYKYTIESYYKGLLYLYFSSDLIDAGIKCYLNNVDEELEIKFYIILEVLENLGYVDKWVEIYEKYQKQVNYRESLKEEYEKYKKIIKGGN